MALTSYDQGDLVRVTATFKNSAKVVTDPTTVTFKFEDPSGNEATYVYLTDAQLVKSSTGIYYVDITPDETGVWTYRFIGTGAVAQVDEGQFYVQPTDITGSTVLPGWNELREKTFAVTRDSARTLVTEANVDQWLQEAVDDLSTRLQLTQNSKTQADSAISSNRIAIPSDYVDLVSLKVDRSGSDNDYVKWVDDETFNAYQEAGSNLSVTIGRVFNGNIELYPTPSGTTYTLRYWSASATSLSGFSGTLRTRVVNYARAHAKWKEGEMGQGDRYMELYERGLPSPNNLGKNRLVGPYTVAPVGNWFDTSEYLS